MYVINNVNGLGKYGWLFYFLFFFFVGSIYFCILYKVYSGSKVVFGSVLRFHRSPNKIYSCFVQFVYGLIVRYLYIIFKAIVSRLVMQTNINGPCGSTGY